MDALNTDEATSVDYRAKLEEKERELAALKREQAKREETEMQKRGEHEKLAAKYAQERDAAQTALIAEKQTNALLAEGQQAGLRNPRYLALIDRADLTVDENGKVLGASAAIAKLKQEDPSLFADSVTRPNTVRTPAGAPATGSDGKTLDTSRVYSADEIQAFSDEQFTQFLEANHGGKPKHSI